MEGRSLYEIIKELDARDCKGFQARYEEAKPIIVERNSPIIDVMREVERRLEDTGYEDFIMFPAKNVLHSRAFKLQEELKDHKRVYVLFLPNPSRFAHDETYG